MKCWQLLCLVTLLGGHVCAQDSDSFPSFEKYQQETLEYNRTVTDQEIVEFFELLLKQLPRDLAEFQNQTPGERKAFLIDLRHAHNEAKVRISTLRGLSDHELLKVEQIGKWRAEQSVIADDANERLRNYSPKQYRVILESALALIHAYDASAVDHLGRQLILDNFPDKLVFVRPEAIYVKPAHCLIYLQKGIGRGIGYSVDLADSGDASIAWFNEYDDWERTTIDLGQSDMLTND